MNSHLVDKFQTPCKFCLFAEWEDEVQTGCKAGKLDTFPNVIEAHDETHEFFVIDEFCKFYRTEEWNDGKPNVLLAETELMPDLTIVVRAENVIDHIPQFKSTLREIQNDEFLSRIKVLLHFKHDYEHREKMIKLVQDFSIITALEVSSELAQGQREKEFSRKISSTPGYFTCFIDCCTLVEAYKRFHYYLNKQNKKLVVYHDGENLFVLNQALNLRTDEPLFEDFMNKLIDHANEKGVYLHHEE